MRQSKSKFLMLILISLMLVSCATTSVVKEPEPGHIELAKRFLNAFGAKRIIITGFERAMLNVSSEYPDSAAELTRRMMANVTAEDMLDMIARIYTRHLSRNDLTELVQFAESPTGKRFFRLSVDNVMAGTYISQNEVMRQFNADELAEIMRFSMSPAFNKMNRVQYKIKAELDEAGRQLGMEKIQEYLDASGKNSNDTAEFSDQQKEAVEITNMRNSIWHIDFKEVNGKQIPATSISYVDGKAIHHISDAGAVPSPDSSLFAVVEVHNREMALVLKSGDKRDQKKTLFKPARGERLCPIPAWSPDGGRVSIIHIQPDRNRQRLSHNIIIADVNDSKIKSHKIPEGIVNFPVIMSPFNKFSWSPDGNKILISWEKAGVLNVDTGRFIKISDNPIIAEWAPDSDSVYYFDVNSDLRNRGLRSFYKRDLDSAEPVNLVDESVIKQNELRNSSFAYGHLVLSPDNSKLMFAGGSKNKLEDVIRIYNIEKNKSFDILKPSQKLHVDAIVISAQWAPDGKSIAVLAIRAKPALELSVELLSLETQGVKKVTKIDLPKNVPETEIIDFLGSVKILGWAQ